MTGRRVDVAQDGRRAVVMDYKTGSSRQYRKMEDDPLMARKRLQLPVYALAVRETLLPDAALRAEYWFISANGGYIRVPVTLDAIEAQFRNTVQAIAGGVRAASSRRTQARPASADPKTAATATSSASAPPTSWRCGRARSTRHRPLPTKCSAAAPPMPMRKRTRDDAA